MYFLKCIFAKCTRLACLIDPKAVVPLQFVWNVVFLSQVSWLSAGKSLNFLAPKFISLFFAWEQIFYDWETLAWGETFFQRGLLVSPGMAVAARQRREEKVCSRKKPSQDGKIFKSILNLGWRWSLRKCRLVTPSSTSPSPPIHSRLVFYLTPLSIVEQPVEM